ncbi:MAG: DUF1206 domain-containing protein [Planctomycetota bacterium]
MSSPDAKGRSKSLTDGLDYTDTPSKGRGAGGGVSGAKIGQILLVVAGLGAVGFAIWSLVGQGNSIAADTRKRDLIDSVTREVFVDHRIKEGQNWPYEHPSTGERTLYPAELCFWTRDGKATLEPTHVLLNGYIGEDEPTLCPDCGRRVVPHNPTPPAELMAEAAGVTLDG